MENKKSIINLYNEDHSSFKSIEIEANEVVDTSSLNDWWMWIINISDNTFDTDNGIEVLFVINNYNNNEEFNGVYILDDDGSVLFEKDDASVDERTYGGFENADPLFEVKGNAKMILNTDPYNEFSPTFTVYNLPGTISDSTETFLDKKVGAKDFRAQIYPNPTNDIINVETEKEKIKEIKIFDTKGNKIHSKEVHNKKIVRINERLESGIYLMRITEKKGNTIVKKFIVN